MIASLILVLSCHAVDGDTLRCGRERVRLSGIDAPEMPGHCRVGRRCVEGDPVASRDSLARGLRRGQMRIERIGHDHYGRTIALAWAGTANLSCWQLAHGQAIYKIRWDQGLRVARACGRETAPHP